MTATVGLVGAFSDLSAVFDFSDYGQLLFLVKNSIIAGAVLGIAGGLIGTFVMTRDLAFAVHGVSELSFAGAAFALLMGLNLVAGAVAGSLLAALAIGVLGVRPAQRNAITGVLMPFGLGLGILFLALFEGRSANKFALLTGQVVAVDDPQLGLLIGVCIAVLAALVVIWRPLMFASVDPHIARAKGVRVSALSVVFMVLLGLTVAVAVQIIGALLVLALLVTPAAAAMRVTSSPIATPLLSVGFALVSMVGGMLLAVGGSLPISPYVTTVSFLIYLTCWAVGSRGEKSFRHPTRRPVESPPRRARTP